MTEESKYDRWMDHSWPVGTPVKIYALGEASEEVIDMGDGELYTSYLPVSEESTEDAAIMFSPLIKKADGNVIKGSECWWIPLEVVNAVGEET